MSWPLFILALIACVVGAYVAVYVKAPKVIKSVIVLASIALAIVLLAQNSSIEKAVFSVIGIVCLVFSVVVVFAGLLKKPAQREHR